MPRSHRCVACMLCIATCDTKLHSVLNCVCKRKLYADVMPLAVKMTQSAWSIAYGARMLFQYILSQKPWWTSDRAYLGPFHGAKAVPSVTRCRRRHRRRRGHRCAGGVRCDSSNAWWMVMWCVVARCGEWAQHFSNASCIFVCVACCSVCVGPTMDVWCGMMYC